MHRDQRLEHRADLLALPRRVEPGQAGPDPPPGGRAEQPERAGPAPVAVGLAVGARRGVRRAVPGPAAVDGRAAAPSRPRRCSGTAGSPRRRLVDRSRTVGLRWPPGRPGSPSSSPAGPAARHGRRVVAGHRPLLLDHAVSAPSTQAGTPTRDAIVPVAGCCDPRQEVRHRSEAPVNLRTPAAGQATASRACTSRGASLARAPRNSSSSRTLNPVDGAAGLLDEAEGGGGGAAGGEHVVDDEHPLTGRERVGVQLQGRLAVLQRVRRRQHLAGAACPPCGPAPRRPRRRRRPRPRSRSRGPRCPRPRRSCRAPWCSMIASMVGANVGTVGEQRHQVLEDDAGLRESPARRGPGSRPARRSPRRCRPARRHALVLAT